MKVVFVGMHFKPDCEALDSKTVSGKMIDKIIEQVQSGCNYDENYPMCIKTNMCQTEKLPIFISDINVEAKSWHRLNYLSTGDVVVLLGKWVQKHFLKNRRLRYVEINHPASVYKKEDKVLYIENAVKEIKKHF